MAEATFRAPVQPSGRGGGHLVEVPPEVVDALGGKGRIPVQATFDGIPYRGSIVAMGGAAVLGVQEAIMSRVGVSVGDQITVVVRNDDAPREIDVPDELARALRADRAAGRAFERLSYSHRREIVKDVAGAKRSETRCRRIERAIERLAGDA